MLEFDIDDVISKLWNLRLYSEELSQRLTHETALPEDPIPFLIERIESAYIRYEAAATGDEVEAQEELAEWLAQSYRFYLRRLARFDRPWAFTFPKVDQTHLH
jgi:hypothetical protein